VRLVGQVVSLVGDSLSALASRFHGGA
jgi:hypothetical protein